MCGNLKPKCRYRDYKFCKKPKEFKCKDILKSKWNNGGENEK